MLFSADTLGWVSRIYAHIRGWVMHFWATTFIAAPAFNFSASWQVKTFSAPLLAAFKANSGSHDNSVQLTIIIIRQCILHLRYRTTAPELIEPNRLINKVISTLFELAQMFWFDLVRFLNPIVRLSSIGFD